jgi:histone-lysine N-methyltransferase SETMAR
MKSAYFMTSALIPLEQVIFTRGRTPHERRLAFHFDNCSVHTGRVSTDWLEEHNILRMPHPPYSPDLASSDFYLFRPAKEKSERIRLAEEDQFFESL